MIPFEKRERVYNEHRIRTYTLHFTYRTNKSTYVKGLTDTSFYVVLIVRSVRLLYVQRK